MAAADIHKTVERSTVMAESAAAAVFLDKQWPF
jgi:hypothetical protein